MLAPCARQRFNKEGSPNEDQHGQHEDGNLDGGPQSHADSQVHFVLVGHQDSRDVFTSVAGDGEDDEPQEGLAEAGFGADIRDGVCQEPAEGK